MPCAFPTERNSLANQGTSEALHTLGNPTPRMAKLAHAVHWTLLLCTLLLPISGMMMSRAGGHGLVFFGIELLAANPDPANPGEMLPLNRPIAGIGYFAHGLLGKVLAMLLHVAGALKHHFVDRDGTLRRMLGGRV